MAKIETYTAFGKNKGTKVTLTGKDKERADRLASGELRECPGCSAAIENSATKCPECGTLINAATGAATGASRISDDELLARIMENKAEMSKAKIFDYIGLPLLIIGVLVLFFGFSSGGGAAAVGIILAIVGGVLFAIGLTKGSNAQSAIKKDVGNTLVRSALEQVFDNVNYQIDGHIPSSTLSQARLLPFDWDKVRGGDYVRATYKGLGIEMSDLRLIEIVETEDSEGNKKEEEREVFKGLWMICDFGKELSADLTLQEKRGGSKLGRKFLNKKSDVEVDNVAFNEKYAILSANPHEVFYILTPHMMEFIVRADEKAGGDSYLKFSREGKVHIAVNSGRDAFEANLGAGATDLEGMRQRFVSEVRYVTDIIDELRLVDTLYKK